MELTMMPKVWLRETLLRASKRIGLFRLARVVTRYQLRILCYHGGALSDEWRFRPMLFMRRSTFESRINFLEANGYQFLPFAESLRRMEEDSLPSFPVTLTIDDGWYGTYSEIVPVLLRHGLTA